MSDHVTRKLVNVLRGNNRPVMALYPVVSGVPAGGKTLTTGAGAWGAYADIIAALGIAQDFWLTQIQYDTINGAQIFEVDIYNATLTANLYQDRIDPTAVTVNLGPTCFPFLIYCSPNTQVQGRAGGAAAKTINVSLLVATGI